MKTSLLSTFPFYRSLWLLVQMTTILQYHSILMLLKVSLCKPFYLIGKMYQNRFSDTETEKASTQPQRLWTPIYFIMMTRELSCPWTLTIHLQHLSPQVPVPPAYMEPGLVLYCPKPLRPMFRRSSSGVVLPRLPKVDGWHFPLFLAQQG